VRATYEWPRQGSSSLTPHFALVGTERHLSVHLQSDELRIVGHQVVHRDDFVLVFGRPQNLGPHEAFANLGVGGNNVQRSQGIGAGARCWQQRRVAKDGNVQAHDGQPGLGRPFGSALRGLRGFCSELADCEVGGKKWRQNAATNQRKAKLVACRKRTRFTFELGPVPDALPLELALGLVWRREVHRLREGRPDRRLAPKQLQGN
jgi:hypothetical protein